MNIRGITSKSAPFAAVLAMTAASALGDGLTVREIAQAKPGHVVREISAYGPNVVWGEGPTNDYVSIGGEYPDPAYWADDDGNRLDISFREWSAGFSGAIVAEDEFHAVSGFVQPSFRPLVTEDGTYYTATDSVKYEWGGGSYIREIKAFRDLAGNVTITPVVSYYNTQVGDLWSFHKMDSGIVMGESYSYGTRDVMDVTTGRWIRVERSSPGGVKSETPSWGTSYSTSYMGDGALFLPNAVSWQSGTVDALYVLPDGASESTLIGNVTNATLKARSSAGALLWTQQDGDKISLVLADASGNNRVVIWSQTIPGMEGGESEDSWDSFDMYPPLPDFPAGFTADGGIFYERLNAATSVRELVLRDAGGVETVLESVPVAGSEDPCAAVFSPLPYRGGLIWMKPLGKKVQGMDMYALRARVNGATFDVDGGAINESVAKARQWSEWDDSVSPFSAEFCTDARIVFERIQSNVRQLCLWDGTTAGDEAIVLAEGYTAAPFIAVNVNGLGGAAAVNKGSAVAPAFHVYAAYPNGTDTTVTAITGATEIAQYSADLASVFSEADATWGLCGAYMNGGPLPGGCSFEVSDGGVLSGQTPLAGDYAFRVSCDKDGETTYKVLSLAVVENPNHRPVVDSATPAPGVANFGAATTLLFSVAAHDDGAALTYRWLVDDEVQDGENGATFTLGREEGDVTARKVRCVVEDDLWTEANVGENVVSLEWDAGVLAVQSVSATSVHVGQRAQMSVVLESTVGFYGSGDLPVGWDITTWYDATTDGEVGVGNATKAPGDGSGTYYAIAKTKYGEVRTGNVNVVFDPAPLAGRIYRRTGPAMEGSRCVLHAGAWGEQPLSFSWTRDGVEVSTSQTLDIRSLGASDFGTYVFTVRNSHGESSSGEYRLAPALTGTVAGWQANMSDTPSPLPEDEITNAVQVAALPHGGVALLADGSVAAWSGPDNGVADVPAGLKAVFVAASRGDAYQSGIAAAVRRDGTVVTWGECASLNNSWHDDGGGSYCEWSSGGDANWISDPSSLTGVVQVAVGSNDGLALRSDGSVAKWFSDWRSDGSGGEWAEMPVAEELESISGAVAVMAFNHELTILLEDGTLVNEYGESIDAAADWPNPRSVSGEMASSWSGDWLVADEDGGVHSGESYAWSRELAEAVTAAVAVDQRTFGHCAVILDEAGVVHEIIDYGTAWTPTNGVIAISCGARHTLVIVAGGAPVELTDEELMEWLADNGLVDAGATPEEVDTALSPVRVWLGGDFAGANARTVTEKLMERASNSKYTYLDCYIANLNPADKNAEFLATIEFDSDGRPVIRGNTELGNGSRLVIWGSKALGDSNGWQDVTNEKDLGEWTFFKVEAVLKGSDD